MYSNLPGKNSKRRLPQCRVRYDHPNPKENSHLTASLHQDGEENSPFLFICVASLLDPSEKKQKIKKPLSGFHIQSWSMYNSGGGEIHHQPLSSLEVSFLKPTVKESLKPPIAWCNFRLKGRRRAGCQTERKNRYNISSYLPITKKTKEEENSQTLKYLTKDIHKHIRLFPISTKCFYMATWSSILSAG